MNKTNFKKLNNAVAKTDDNLTYLKLASNNLSLTKEFIKTATHSNLRVTLAMVQIYMDGLEEVLISIRGQLKEVADDLADISESEE
ncbi:hypothetical protein EB06_02198 [Enterococcus cecorum]|uniref:hypothetical protein n=1 Tax=Enterococcus cecorum TaxID=44008 RepID=UPI000DEB5E08|nr:hypothetical protein [Enterococcus cecorum]RBR27235.1 hypothetical protein EB06_02198 [Enterococcus cecorum]